MEERNMNKILATIAALAMVMAVAVAPAMAETIISGVTTGATIGGQGTPPLVKVKWEQIDPAIYGTDEDGDMTHQTLGAQILPPCEKSEIGTRLGLKPVQYYAIVTDPQGLGNIKQVKVVVYHPQNSWEQGSEKYQFTLNKVTDKISAIALFTNAYDHGLVTLNQGITKADVIDELQQDHALLYTNVADLDYEQPGGDYRVVASVTNNQDIEASLINTFNYVPTTCFALDNTNINYGQVPIGAAGIIKGGDTNFVLNDGGMTVRNLGNTNMQMVVGQDDMGFGQDINQAWKVYFDGRAGWQPVPVDYYPVKKVADPGAIIPSTILPGIIQHSTDEKLDFSIHVLIASTGGYSGNMALTSVIV